MRFRLLLPRLAVMLAIVAPVGCGAGGTSSSAPRSAKDDGPTPADFAARADDLCERASDRIVPLQREAERNFDVDNARAAKLLERSERIQRKAIAQLADLGVPQGREATVKRYLRALQGRTDALGALAAAVRQEDVTAVEDASAEVQRLAQRASRAADALGLTECSPPVEQ